MERRIFRSVSFTVFLRLQIYEAFAAIFRQSAGYVIKFLFSEICSKYIDSVVFCNLTFLVFHRQKQVKPGEH